MELANGRIEWQTILFFELSDFCPLFFPLNKAVLFTIFLFIIKVCRNTACTGHSSCIFQSLIKQLSRAKRVGRNVLPQVCSL